MTFSQFFAILRARWKICLMVFFGVVLLTIAGSLILPKKYTAIASVVVDIKPDPISAVMYNAAPNPAILATQIDIITSDRVAQRVVRDLHLAENPEVRKQWQTETEGRGSIEQWFGEQFLRDLDVKPARESNVISVAYKARDPQFAAGLANAFVKAYLETSVELRVDPAKQYSNFFDTQAKDARDVLEKAQAKVSAFQKEKGIIATDERFDVENQRLNDLSAQLVSIQALATDSSSRESAASRDNVEHLPEVLNNAVISGLQADLARADAKLKELSARYGDAHPQVVEAKANITELRRRIGEETAKVKASVGVSNSVNQQRVADIRAAVEAQRAKVLQMKAVRDEGAVLVRDADNAERNYEQVVARQNQSSLESQVNQTNVSVLTAAVPPIEASSPRIVLNAIVAVFVGVLLAVAVALLIELSDRRVRNVDDLVQAINLPILGVIPSPAARRSLFHSGRANHLMQQRLLGQLPAPNKSV